MKAKLLLFLTPLLCLSLLRTKAGQEQRSESVTVTGALRSPLTVSTRDLSTMPRAEATVNDHGKSVRYEGVPVSEILKKAGAPMGDDLHGKALASYVLAEGRDGYQVLYSMAELDPALTQAKVLLADRMDGKPLPDSVGPFRLIAPEDKKLPRSVRMLEKLELVRLQP